MAHLNTQPPGMAPLGGAGRKTVVKVVSGDTWTLAVNLVDPSDRTTPATPENTIVTVALSETQFDAPIWTGEWYDGVRPDEVRKGLCHIEVPKDLTAALRRGSYEFSVRVSDLLKSSYATEAEGSFLVEYSTAGDNHSIPYKDGTGESGTTSASSSGGTSSGTTFYSLVKLQKTVSTLSNRLDDETAERKAADAGIKEDSEKSYAKTEHTHSESQVEGLEDSLEEAVATAKAYADKKTGTILDDAKAYADGKSAEALSDAKTYADAHDAASLASAKDYADAKDAATLQAAKDYADTKAGGVTSVAGKTGAVVLGTSDITGLDAALATAGAVKSVNGMTGTVVLTADSIGAAEDVHTHTTAQVTGLDAALAKKVDATDARLSDARTPTAHKAAHATGGSDALTPADIGAAAASHSHAISDVTDLQDRLASAESNAKSYADTKDEAGLAAAKTYSDSKASTALSDAKTYADTKDAAVLQSAKDYTDAQAGVKSVAGRTGDVTLSSSDISDLQTKLDAKAAVSHTHVSADITDLQAKLDAKSDVSHTHAVSDVTGLQTALDAKASASDVVSLTARVEELEKTVAILEAAILKQAVEGTES